MIKIEEYTDRHKEEIYLGTTSKFLAAHRFYEKNGLYDFPQYDERIIETNKFMFEMTSTPEGKEAIRKMLKQEMVKPHKKVVEKE